jgi:NAD(P)-dependent dehydrogenase (short-subunit alcohol dehydrogenase family)
MEATKVALITGSTDGIGKATALGLAQRGYAVILHGRDRIKGERAAEEIRRRSPDTQVDLLIADMAAQREIRAMAQRLHNSYEQLNVLVNNVGALFAERRTTVDGIEAMWAVNHLASFLLTNLLFEQLKAAGHARIVNVSAGSQAFGNIVFDDIEFKRRQYAPRVALAQSKLANILFAYELARRWKPFGITANAVDPLGAATPMTTSQKLPWHLKLLTPFFTLPVEQAAFSSIYAASAPELAGVTGKYFSHTGKPKRSAKRSYKLETAQQLWDVSARMTGLAETKAAPSMARAH